MFRAGILAAISLCGAIGSAGAQACPLYVLERSEGVFEVRREEVADGEALVYTQGPRFIGLILPWSAGVSGNVVQASAGPTATAVRCAAGTLRVTIQSQGAAPRVLPDVEAASLRRYRIRVNVFPHRGSPSVFIITPNGAVSRDTLGPPTDMFRGQVPLGEGDVSITTEVRDAVTNSAVTGSADLRREGPYFVAALTAAGGGSGDVIVDLGASRTVITRAMLPPGIIPRPLVAVEYGPGGQRERAGTTEALGGEVGGISAAQIPSLEMGTLRFSDASVHVIDTLPTIAGLTLGGVIGTDLLGQAPITRLESTPAGGRVLLDTMSTDAVAVLQLPFTQVGGLIVLTARAGEHRIPLILDTGARSTLLSPSAARALQLTPSTTRDTFRGLDGREIEAWRTTIPRLDFGSGHIDSLVANVASLAVLERMGVPDGGLLGQNIWERFAALEIDWRQQVVRFYARQSD